MKITKKVLGVVLALAMLVNVFAMFSFAAAPDSAVDLTIKADKESYKPGDIVTLTVSEKCIPDVVGDLRIGGAYAIGYQSDKIEMRKTGVYDNLITNLGFTAHQEGYDDGGSNITWTDGVLVLGDEIDEQYNAVTILSVADDGMTGFDATAGVDLFSFQMKIADNCPDGEYVVGFNKGSYVNYSAFSNDQKNNGIYGYTDDFGYGTTANYGFNNCTIKVSSAAEGPTVAKKAAQAKFISDPTTEDKVADEFKLRIKSVITDAVWDEYFANTTDDAATTNKITAVGMVAFPASAEFDRAEADKAIAAIDGTKEYAGAYKAASTTYIQKDGDAADAYFGAIINIKHSTCTSNLKYIGYVQYLDNTGAAQTIYYNAAIEAGVSGDQYKTLAANFVAGKWSAD